MSEVLSITTIVGALEAASEFAGPVNYRGQNDQQNWLLKRYAKYKNALPDIDELETWAKKSAEEINEILEQRGFNIRLAHWDPDPRLFGTLGILDLTLTWLVPGKSTTIKDKAFPAFSHESRTLGETFSINDHDEPIIKLATLNEDVVSITKSKKPLNEFEMVETVERLRRASIVTTHNFERVVVPKINFVKEVDIDWIIGMESGVDPDVIEVVAAKQEVRFGMNEIGARVKEASAFAMIGRAITVEVPTYVVDEPFLLWVDRPGLEIPIFQAWFNEDNWEDPGDLANL